MIVTQFAVLSFFQLLVLLGLLRSVLILTDLIYSYDKEFHGTSRTSYFRSLSPWIVVHVFLVIICSCGLHSIGTKLVGLSP